MNIEGLFEESGLQGVIGAVELHDGAVYQRRCHMYTRGKTDRIAIRVQ